MCLFPALYNWSVSCLWSPPFLLNMHSPALKGDFHLPVFDNDIRDLTAKLLTEVYSQVAVEPELEDVTLTEYPHSTANIQDGAC